ncbi:basic blue protein [Brachypodium distachyon]|uniref:Phytocyanin domain-containing protein n=1 Tax=Brachypodium distachyon TaxID=15368 RepID=I1H3F1_BRADI|nr:basic blue protein [Brachypodium distachyon]KQK20740.1 hypothetical protein BRADI_1g56560v3 [Brachypodium distachyon]|eukprot:XP_003561387.1 basic blue protein [Brachypodium distachyon]
MASQRQVPLLTTAAIAFLIILPWPSSAEEYRVGGVFSWSLLYPSNWTDGKNFTVGDSLMFLYRAGRHTVVEVTGAGFSACNATGKGNQLGSWSSGRDAVRLDKVGRRWFICDVEDHCTRGMRLLVTVAEDNATSSAAAAPSLNFIDVGVTVAVLVIGASAALMF